eukprot:m.341247 g.341247  ORF g.341247 m.341247 type:complete len:370 (-) comp19957_c0_seq1:208-1317(-)
MSAVFQCMAVEEFGAPLKRIVETIPQLKGSEVLVKNEYSGVCHSDAHIHDGYFNVGGGAKLNHPFPPPFSLGHEMEGIITDVGPEANKSLLGRRVAVYPWLGCSRSSCVHCDDGQTNVCMTMDSERFIDGRSLMAGYSSHVIVPHDRWVIPLSSDIPPGIGAINMCAGLTAYSALKKVGHVKDVSRNLVIIGLGGVGMQAVHIAHALFGEWPIGVDLDAEKRAEAARLGCITVDGKSKTAINDIRKQTQGKKGVASVVDFVGNDATFNMALQMLRAGGKVVPVGLYGAKLNIGLPFLIFQQKSIVPSLCGTLQEAKDLMALMIHSKIETPPHEYRSIVAASSALDDLKAGQIKGRCILKHDWPGPGSHL